MEEKDEIVFDIETNGLLESTTTIWCATFKKKDTIISFIKGEPNKEKHIYSIKQLPSFLNARKDTNIFICHNMLKFDREVFSKIYGITLPLKNCIDTLIFSQMMWPDIAVPKGCKGKHGLESWGARFGVPKPVHEDWSQYSEEMLHRNIVDVNINYLLWLKIKEKLNN